MNWYKVVKIIRGRRYLYWQKTYRVGKQVKTLNKYIGPATAPVAATSFEYVADLKKLGELMELPSLEDDDLPDWHRDLLERYEDGQITKEDYEKFAAENPHVHDFVWQLAPDYDGNTHELCGCGKVGRVHRYDEEAGQYFTVLPEDTGSSSTADSAVDTILRNDDAFKLEQVSKSERTDYERIRWGTKTQRMRRAKTKLRAAKKRIKAAGKKRINPFIG